MAIEKMKLLSITGSDNILDSFIARNLLESDIQIEDAKKIYSKTWKLEYYDYDYEVKDTLKKCRDLINRFNIIYKEDYSNLFIENTVGQIDEKIEKIIDVYEKYQSDISELEKQRQEKIEKIQATEPIADVNVNIQRIYNLKYIKFRFGNIANDKLEEIRDEIDSLNAILFEIKRSEDTTCIMYVTTAEFEKNVDVFFNMQNFERIWLDSELSGTPKEYIDYLYRELNTINTQIIEKQKDVENLIENCRHILLSSYRQLQTYNKINKIKKYIMHDSKNTFYIVAWIPESEVENIVNKLDSCQGIDYKIEEKIGNNKSPTKLKNNRLFKPFELIVKMYGVPNSGEIDPTSFVAITAILMFGFMFGDIGHGLIFLIVRITFTKEK